MSIAPVVTSNIQVCLKSSCILAEFGTVWNTILDHWNKLRIGTSREQKKKILSVRFLI